MLFQENRALTQRYDNRLVRKIRCHMDSNQIFFRKIFRQFVLRYSRGIVEIPNAVEGTIRISNSIFYLQKRCFMIVNQRHVTGRLVACLLQEEWLNCEQTVQSPCIYRHSKADPY